MAPPQRRWRASVARDREPWSLPLFPLRTVLFPGGLLPLKVFEQRYIEMTKACLRDERPFGVCLITQGDEVAQRRRRGAPSSPASARWRESPNFDMPQLGILHLQTEGVTRFEVRAACRRCDRPRRRRSDDDRRRAAHPLPEIYAPLARILELIAAKHRRRRTFRRSRRYDDASWVGYRLAELLPLPLSIKQRMLEVNDANVRLTALKQFLERQGLV